LTEKQNEESENDNIQEVAFLVANLDETYLNCVVIRHKAKDCKAKIRKVIGNYPHTQFIKPAC
jgi:formyltetrahydrofolate hydrolase